MRRHIDQLRIRHTIDQSLEEQLEVQHFGPANRPHRDANERIANPVVPSCRSARAVNRYTPGLRN